MKHLKLLMLFCSMAFTAAAQFSGTGSGSMFDPYRITNADQLNEVRNVSGRNVYFSLDADIDLADWIENNYPVTGWQPIGTIETPFAGIFNGNGHVISNIWVDSPDKDYVGLFGYASDAKFYDINVVNGVYNGHNEVGGIVGQLYWDSNSAISGCSFQGSIEGYSNLGGIAGHSLDITDCHVKETTIKGDGTIGGIAGAVNGKIYGCTFQGEIEGDNLIGGIAGSALFMDECHVSNAVITGGGSVGGIMGSLEQIGKISNCSFQGEITGTRIFVGGIIGITQAGLSITNCQVEQTIINSSSSVVGGIIGCLNYGSEVSGCSFDGNVTGTSAVGGIAGISSGTLTKCFSSGTINCDDDGGGISGEIYNESGSMSDCYSNAIITAEENGGGISALNNGTIRNCYFYGKVSGNTVGGICADNSGSITGCVAANAALSGVVAGRIAGVNTGTLETTQNYALAEMEVTVGGELQNVVDSPENGTARSKVDLMKQATYRAMEWDFTNTWKIDEGTSFPYLPDFYVPVTEITLDNAEVTLDKGLTLGIVATILPENAHNTTVLWSSSNASVATVDCNGLVTAIAAGEAEITATSAGSPEVKAICQVTVNQKLVETIALDKTELSMEKGATWQLMATVMPEDADDKSVTWISSDTGVATVDDNGLVTAVEAGSATITATTNDGSNLSANCSVTVTDPTSGIDNVGVGNVDVSTAKGRIMISGKSGDVPVVVYTLTGQLVHSGNENVIDVTGSSLYIVRIMGNSYKVFVP